MACWEETADVVLASNGDNNSLMLESSAQADETAAGNSSSRMSPEPPPVVFFCAQCKRVLGDSLSWMESDTEDMTVLLKEVSSFVTSDKKPTHSSFPQDHCCTIVSLFCSGCSSRIGKAYISTPRHLDYKRGHFCLDVEAIDSYEIGSATVQEIAKEDEPVTMESRWELEDELEKVNTTLKFLHADISALKSEHS